MGTGTAVVLAGTAVSLRSRPAVTVMLSAAADGLGSALP
jgi:hypothetical protein